MACSTASTRSARSHPSSGACCIVGGGAHSQAYRQVLADLSGRAVLVPRGDQQVATGACVQAAAVVTGDEPADIADRWRLGEGDEVEPGPGATAAADVRGAYGALRDATAVADVIRRRRLNLGAGETARAAEPD